MKKSELKEMIRQAMLAETEEKETIKEGVWSVLPARIPEFIQAIEDIKEEYHAVVGSDDVFNGLDQAISAAEELLMNTAEINEAKKLTYNDFVRMVRDDMMVGATPDEYPSDEDDERIRKDAKYLYNRYLQGASVDDLFEAKKDEEVDVEADAEEIDIDTDAETADTGEVDMEIGGDKGLKGPAKEIDDSLEAAIEAARELGDQKLIDQIGNTITFFTRTHIVGKDEVTGKSVEGEDEDMMQEESINRFKKLAGLIK